MLPITTPECYKKGFYKLSQNKFEKDQLECTIDEHEKCVLQDLLGCDLAELFIADLANDPKEDRFIDLFDPFCYDNAGVIGTMEGCDCHGRLKSDGIKAMLQGFVYYHYTVDQRYKHTIAGIVTTTPETSDLVTATQHLFYCNKRWNKAVFNYRAIQSFIKRNLDVYPEYKGVCKDFIFFT